MQYLVKAELTKDETKAFKGRCLTPQNFGRVTFEKGDVVEGDEYYVNKAVEQGATAGDIIKAEKPKK